MRREFELFDYDKEYLDKRFPDWESCSAGRWILIPNFILPSGFTCSTVTAAIQIPQNYPVTSLDMVYFHPAVHRKDGCAIKCTDAKQLIDGLEYQRWSRHYKSGQWISGESTLATHVMAILGWLEKESGEVAA